MNNCNISKVVSHQILNINEIAASNNPILAVASILKAHRFSLNSIHQINKTQKSNCIFSSPFTLKPKGTRSFEPSFINRFSCSNTISDSLVSKISSFNHTKAVESPMQAFSKSLSTKKNDNDAGSKAVGISEKLKTGTSTFTGEIVDVISENQEFRTIRIKKPDDWNFQPGQYLELRPEGGDPTKRPSILAIASGTNGDFIEITAKPNKDPAHPNYFLNGNPGDRIVINGPLGSNFPIDLITKDTSVMVLGGGSGITALNSVVQSIPEGTDMQIIYSSKNEKDLIYRDEINKWKDEGHIVSLTQDKVDGFSQGRITDHLNNIEIKPNTMVFICGPKELVLDTAKKLVELGVAPECIYGSLPALAKDGGPVYRGDHPKMGLVTI
ncbi:MAG: FAD-dependent oxidoreductase [Parachlamydiaceae bacterium]|nr:FAD-dependent oxidoreductase [Parachlamydiaceae bacterium]